MSRLRILLAILMLWGASFASARPAAACPMCKVAIEEQQDAVALAQPRAYMYSILFMLSMPFSIAAFFGVTFYRMTQKQQAINAELLNLYDTVGDA